MAPQVWTITKHLTSFMKCNFDRILKKQPFDVHWLPWIVVSILCKFTRNKTNFIFKYNEPRWMYLSPKLYQYLTNQVQNNKFKHQDTLLKMNYCIIIVIMSIIHHLIRSRIPFVENNNIAITISNNPWLQPLGSVEYSTHKAVLNHQLENRNKKI